MRRPAVILGEAICDLFTPEPGVDLADAPVLVPMVDRVLRLLAERGVGVDAIARFTQARTGLLLIQVDADGERHFHPWRERAADLLMSPQALPEALIAGAALLHHGTVTLRGHPARSATFRAAALARASNVPVSVDVNLRPKMYSDPGALRTQALAAVRGADVVKAAVEEAALLLGGASSAQDLCQGLLQLGPSLVLLTDGPRPLHLASRRQRVQIQPPRVQIVDSTGAGDAFTGTVVAAICERGLNAAGLAALGAEDLTALGQRAAEAGARAVTALGATGAFTPPESKPM
jgi:fructokinase